MLYVVLSAKMQNFYESISSQLLQPHGTKKYGGNYTNMTVESDLTRTYVKQLLIEQYIPSFSLSFLFCVQLLLLLVG